MAMDSKAVMTSVIRRDAPYAIVEAILAVHQNMQDYNENKCDGIVWSETADQPYILKMNREGKSSHVKFRK